MIGMKAVLYVLMKDIQMSKSQPDAPKRKEISSFKGIYYYIRNRWMICPRSCSELCDFHDDGFKQCWSHFGRSVFNISLLNDEAGHPMKVGPLCPGVTPSQKQIDRITYVKKGGFPVVKESEIEMRGQNG